MATVCVHEGEIFQRLSTWEDVMMWLPECLWLYVLDHNRVDELPPAVVGAEPASDIPGANPDS